MKSVHTKSIFHMISFLCMLMLLFGLMPTTHAWADKNASLPAEQVLHSSTRPNSNIGQWDGLNLKKYDPALGSMREPPLKSTASSNTWSALGAVPLNGWVLAMARNGTDLYIGGDFTDAGGDPNADRIAKWDGTAWSPLGMANLNRQVYAIAISGDNIYIGGEFTDAGGDPDADYIAKWDGTSWSAVGSTPLNNYVSSIAILGTDIYVGGNFTNAGGNPNADHIARWNGSSWSSLGTVALDGSVYVMTTKGTDLYVGGSFLLAGQNRNLQSLAKWNGTTWSAVGNGLGNATNSIDVYAIAFDGEDVYVGGYFQNIEGDPNADSIVKWDGKKWSALGSGIHFEVYTIAVNNGFVYAGGSFLDAGGDANLPYIAKWDGITWSAVGPKLNSFINEIIVDGTDIYTGGNFINASGDINADYVAKIAQSCYSLNTDINPVEGGSVSINPPPNCNGGTQYLSGTTVTVTAFANSKFIFSNWNGDANGTSESLQIIMSSDKSIMANFTSITFEDVPASHWAWTFIEHLYKNGITGGCSSDPMLYCPNLPTTRAQMAVFILKAEHGTAYTPPTAAGTVFMDVPLGHWAGPWIEALAAEGITGGCGNALYCPDTVVTRDQMAVFLLRGIHGNAYTPPAATGFFGDVPADYWAAPWIEALANEGITSGCGYGNYCPDIVVTRDQMAVFLVGSFNLP